TNASDARDWMSRWLCSFSATGPALEEPGIPAQEVQGDRQHRQAEHREEGPRLPVVQRPGRQVERHRERNEQEQQATERSPDEAPHRVRPPPTRGLRPIEDGPERAIGTAGNPTRSLGASARPRASAGPPRRWATPTPLIFTRILRARTRIVSSATG